MACYGCPHCGSDDIREANVAFTHLRIIDWNEDGTPAKFDGDEDVEWQSDDDADPPLECFNCHKQFGWAGVVRMWTGEPDPNDPDNYWIDDDTGERVNAATGERTKP